MVENDGVLVTHDNPKEIEIADLKQQISELEFQVTDLQSRRKFSWPAFFTMAVIIGVVLSLGIFVPGVIDEYAAILIITAIYGFASANGFALPKKLKQ